MADYDLLLTVDQRASFSLTPKDSKDGSTAFDGEPEFAPDAGGIVDFEFDAGKLTGYILGVSVGQTTISVTGDGDLSAGTRPVVKTIGVTVVPGEAQDMDIALGEPEAKPVQAMAVAAEEA